MKDDDPLKEYRLTSKVKAALKRQKDLREALQKGARGQDVLEFSDKVIDDFQIAAKKLFEEKRYEEAADAFLFLISLRPEEGQFWMGLGAALQADHAFEEAIDAYEMAAIHDIENPWPYLYLGKCLFAIHDRGGALLAIEMAIEYAAGNSLYDDLLVEAVKAKAVLEHAGKEEG